MAQTTEADELYDRCVERARTFLEQEGPDFYTYYIENSEAIDMGIWVGVTGAILQLVQEGHLSD